MNWLFWKNTSSNIKKHQTHDLLRSLERGEENSYSFWKQELSNNKYHSIGSSTFAKNLGSYERFFMNEPGENVLIETEKKKFIEWYNLCKTLDNLDAECEEGKFQKFSETARKNAKQILRFIYSEFPKYEYYIYPTEDREVAIDCNPQKGKGKGIVVLCDSNDGIACFATFEGKNRRFRYNSIDDFSYRLLRETFEELDIEKKHLLVSPSSGDSFSILRPTDLNYNLPKNETYSYA